MKRFYKIISALFVTAGIFFTLFTGQVFKANAIILPTFDVSLQIDVKDKTYFFTYPEIDLANGEFYLKNVEDVVDGIYLDALTKPIDAYVDVNTFADEPFTYHKEKIGKGIDKDKLISDISYALSNGINRIKCGLIDIYPDVYLSYLKETTILKGEFTTRLDYSVEQRKHNVSLCSKIINFQKIEPNGIFSFNDVVGERSEERGFLSAKVIENGQFTEGIGGGVCQVSSTIYNAVILSGLKIKERHRHTLAVNYVEPSFDAMVNFGSSDLKFQNDTSAPIYVLTDSDGNYIRARIYGQKNEYEIKRISSVLKFIEPKEPQIYYTDELKKGEIRTISPAKQGIISEGEVLYYKNGKVVKSKLLSHDEYSSRQGIIEIGK